MVLVVVLSVDYASILIVNGDMVEELTEVLGLRRGDRVAIIGSGGKTTLLKSMAACREWGVVLTTTTHLAPPAVLGNVSRKSFAVATAGPKRQGVTPVDYDAVFVNFTDLPSFMRRYSCIGQSVAILTGRYTTRDTRIGSLTPDEVDSIAAHPEIGLVAVEADGSRRLPVKMHAQHEPVLFSSCNFGIAVLGMRAWGRTLCEEQVFRPTLLQEYLGVEPEHRLTLPDLAKVAENYLEHLPTERRALVLSQSDLIPINYVSKLANLVLRRYRQSSRAGHEIRVVAQTHEGLLLMSAS